MSAARTIDPRAYSKLLGKALPTVIHTVQQNEHYIELLEEIDGHEHASAEEIELAELPTLLIEEFEEKHYALKPATPVAILKSLMEDHGLKQKDLLDVFGTESVVSEVLRGKRDFSKEHIRRLSKRFHVSPELFF